MDIKEIMENDVMTVNVSGEIDGSNAADFEEQLRNLMPKASRMILDLGDLEYVSSAGLRVFLVMQKLCKGSGRSMSIRNVTEDVMDIFSITGFIKLLNIEE